MINSVIETGHEVTASTGEQQKMVTDMNRTSEEVATINGLDNSVGGQVNEYVKDIQFAIDTLVVTAGKAQTLERSMDQVCHMCL